ncbi:DUF2283 domain-containing protein [Tardiphaga sp. 1201_B9_N1_2]|uniref:DUF2283 domain-containing protein n=1 Tax=Tardiphaga sp. 1201_B9_N1_2 TaxID=3240378 RepID=UPI003F21AB45
MHDERARQAPTSQRNKNPDSLYIALKDAPGAGSREIVAGLVVDLDANGDVVWWASLSIRHPASSTSRESRRSRCQR